jgi:hypothetical protein
MKIPCDKWAHFFGGAAVAFAAGDVYDPAVGFAISCVAWALKEVVDWMGYGTPDRYDFLASVAGAAAAATYLVAIQGVSNG